MQRAIVLHLQQNLYQKLARKWASPHTSVMPVIRGAFSHQAADNTQWADTIDRTVCSDWLQVTSSCIIFYGIYAHNLMLMRFARLVAELLAIFIEVVIGFASLVTCKLHVLTFIVVVIALLRSDHK